MNPMPQADPMSAPAFVALMDRLTTSKQQVEAVTQRDRDTLTKAAERFCKICPGPGCPRECKVADKSDCGYWQTIAQKGKI